VCVAGLLGTALCHAYDTRVVVMTGGCLAGLGFILASQATSLVHLYLTMGVISGKEDPKTSTITRSKAIPRSPFANIHLVMSVTSPGEL